MRRDSPGKIIILRYPARIIQAVRKGRLAILLVLVAQPLIHTYILINGSSCWAGLEYLNSAMRHPASVDFPGYGEPRGTLFL